MPRPDRSRSYRELRAPAARLADRAAAGFLLILMAAGSLALWIGVPAFSLWAASKLVDNIGAHFVVGLAITLPSMVLFASFLFWLNRLYLRITIPARIVAELDDEEEPVRIRGPLEPLLVASLVVAIVAITVWFFGFAKNPPRRLF